ncbi:hypothetical protein [Shewanella algae]|uniref:hypothetical protein n=1 Tax=Shewanella algae TaxID=38313 RepID=UPI001183A4F1|nr:hypothetical protein [Shewanella algae]MBO2628929.1 hypothetical protein [Shewanella algae]TVL15786.1 hypothetical protein AYJ02_08780 [Shewanella algae]TWO85578.1 hypothetical protein AYI75_00015 [Shewanella algae]UZD56727.1 hypothetical protein OLL83_002416 [Shewanella algae]
MSIRMKWLATAFLLFTPLHSYAYYPTYVSDTTHLTTIEDVHNGRSIVLKNSSVGAPIHKEVKDILNSINGEIKNSLTIAAKDGINGLGGRFRNLVRSELTGELTTKIITEGNGVVKVEVGGFNLSAEVKFDYAGITLYGDVTTSKLKFTADYDVITGEVYNLRDVGNTKVYVDVDGNGIINNLVAETAEELLHIFKPNMFNNLVSESLGKLVNNRYYVGGINSVIPEGKWVFEGVDVGKTIKNSIKGVSPGKYVSLSISEWKHRYYYGGGTFRYYYRNKLTLDVSNNYIVTYENEPVFSTGNWINPCASGASNHGCYEP